MKRFLLILLTALLTCSAMSAQTVTVSPSNPRMYNRFIYNYRSVLRDFDIDPDVSNFVSPSGDNTFPAFLIKGNDGLIYAVSAADIVAFADNITVTIADTTAKISYQDLKVVNISEKLNLAVIRMPDNLNANALEIDSVWFSDESEQYSSSARLFLKSVPMTVSGDAGTINILYNRMAASAAEGYYYILPNLSYKYLYSKTADQIADGIDSLSEADYTLFRNMNANGDVISAMRILAGDMAARRMKKDLQSTNTIVKENSVALEGKNGEYITFVQEFGAWRILSDTKPQSSATTNYATYTSSEASAEYTSEATTTSIIDRSLVGALLTGKVMVPYDFRDQGVSGSFSIGYLFRYVSVEAVFEYNSFGVYRDRFYDPYYYNGVPYNSDYRYSSFFGFGIRLGGHLPIMLTDKLTIAPKVQFEWETPMLCRDSYSYVNAISPMVGADLFVKFKNGRSAFFVGVEYEQKFIFNYNYLRVKNNTMGYFDFNFGFLF